MCACSMTFMLCDSYVRNYVCFGSLDLRTATLLVGVTVTEVTLFI